MPTTLKVVLSMLRRRFQAFSLLALHLQVLSGLSDGQSVERLYAYRMVGGIAGGYIDVLDPATGTVEQVVPIRGSYVAQIGFTCLAHDGNRLLSIAAPTGNITSKFGQIRQADGIIEDLWNSGIKWSWFGLDVNRITGRTYAVCQLNPPLQTQVFLYEYDSNSQLLSVVAPLNPQIGTAFSFVISPSGQAFVFDPIGPSVYTLDLATGSAAYRGSLALPGAFGFLWDAAFDGAGALWVSYEEGTNTHTGIYKIDMATLGYTKIVSLSSPYYGLAWGPAPALTSYCTAKISSQGCTPTIAALGYPCAVALKGLTISATNVPNQELGLLMYSTTGPQSVPFQGGTLCLKTPVRRTPTSSSGGNASPANDCSGSMTLDFNEYLHDSGASHSPPGPPLPPGTNVCAQWWGRDPGFSAPSNTSLSNAIRFDLAP